MKRKTIYRVPYKRDYKRVYRGIYRKVLEEGGLLDTVIDTLRQGKKLDKKYKDHILKGDFAGFHECHIKPDWLLLYLIEEDILTLTLVDTGSHSDLFNK